MFVPVSPSGTGNTFSPSTSVLCCFRVESPPANSSFSVSKICNLPYINAKCYNARTMVKASTQYKREHKADYGREKIELLYHDQWIAVINKPTGLLSVPYPGSKVRTAQSVLEELLR